MNEDTNFFSYSPITNEKLGPFKNMSFDEVKELYKKADEVQKVWRQKSVKNRMVYVRKIIKILSQNVDSYCEMIYKDNGKTEIEALMTEIFSTLGILDYYVKNAKKILKTKKVEIPFYLIGKSGYIIYEPLGVVGVISPWNYPFQL